MHNRHVLRPEAAAALDAAVADVVVPALAGRPAHERAALLTRLERHFTELHEPWTRLYAGHAGGEAALRSLVGAVVAADAARPEALRRIDHEREITPDWFQREQEVGYVAYVDKFAGTLARVRDRIPYLRELGVTYLHLMPLLEPRPAPNDGGYAVADYGAVDPALGTMDDLRELTAALHEAGMSLCIDVVVNHTAREHAWAQGAMAGDPAMLARYRTFPDRTEPDAYEETLPQVFPDVSPGNFTWIPEMAGTGRWTWTTFYDYQWDLDWSNPDVAVQMAAIVLHLANQGVDVLRLDAVPFLWKRVGTDCQNQPEVHDVLQALRAVVRVAAPAVAFKAEAIVSPQHLVPYLGVGRHEGKECDLAYHNSLMVLLWSTLASGRAALITHTLRAMPVAPPRSGWVTYVRNHDDIGWAVTEEDAGAVGENGYLHRRFLVDWYSGEFAGSPARGAPFQRDPRSGEARVSGSAASLAGLETALEAGDERAVDLAIRRLLLVYGVVFSYGGIPLVYMGDELGLRNDHAYLADPSRAHDNRWMHRPEMDWEAAERRADPATVEGRLWAGLRRLVQARRGTRAIHAAGSVEPLWTGNDHVFGYTRRHAGDALLCLCNATADAQWVHHGVLHAHGFDPGQATDGPDDRPVRVEAEHVVLEAYQYAWFRHPDRY